MKRMKKIKIWMTAGILALLLLSFTACSDCCHGDGSSDGAEASAEVSSQVPDCCG